MTNLLSKKRKPIVLLCGVPGSGKTWVIDQLDQDNYFHIPHDKFSHEKIVRYALQIQCDLNIKRIIIDCPFAERSLRQKLEDQHLTVIPVFIVETPETIRIRYMNREGHLPSQNILTRAETIMDKVLEWKAYYGTSKEVLDYLTKFKDIEKSYV